MPNILFVCTANRYRSPIAAACFRKELARRKLQEKWKISSAGTWTTDGLPASSDAITSAKRLGLDISNHQSRAITGALMQDADLILVMEQGQKEALEIEFPKSAHKVHLLTEAATGISYDIPDPAVSSSAGEVHTELDELIRQGFDRLRELANAH
jgi:protein-tyrosine phosphatase